MKKYLLGALMLMGVIAYGQGNQVITPINGEDGETSIGIEVTGEVFAKTNKSLVVELKSSATPDGKGFAFQMPDLFTSQASEGITGKFEAKVMQNDTNLKLKEPIEVKLIGADGEEAETAEGQITGTANDTQLLYTVTGTSKKDDLSHNGTVIVTATAGNTPGFYNDNSVSLKIKISGQSDSL